MRLFPSFGLLFAILSFVALSTADETSQPDTIPASVRGQVPDCVKTCLENFIASSYPETCTTLDCMCRTKTPSTLTLGEAAASCYYALCSSETRISNDLYQACDSVPNHFPNTHATLTATTFAAPTTTKPVPDATTTKEPEPTKTTHTTEPLKTTLAPETSISPEITYLHTTSTAESTTAPQTPRTVGTSSSSTPTPTPTNSTVPAGGKKDSSSVSSGTVIGVSVASGIAGTFIVGVAVFFLCRRWRNRRQTGDFEIGGVMTEPSNFSNDSRGSLQGPGPSYPPGGASRGQQEMSQNPQSPRVAAWVAQSPPTIKIVSDGHQSPQKTRDIGLAVGSDADWETSPRTADSLSELVPKSAGLYPKPLQWFRPDSWQTVFEEDENQSKYRSKGKQPEYQPSQQSTPDPQNRSRAMGLPSNPRAPKNGFQADQFRRATNQTRSNGSPTPHGTPYTQSKKLGSPFTGTALRASPNLVSIGPKSSTGSPHISSDSNPSNTTISSSSIQGIGITGRTSPPKGLPANPKPSRNPSDPAQEVVSKPRIVRSDDIKRVEPGKSSRPPSEVVAPYCPDDLWLERSRKIASRGLSTELPYPSELTPGTLVYPSSPKKQAQNASKRISPSGRNLTPSRRGDDLYLSVD